MTPVNAASPIATQTSPLKHEHVRGSGLPFQLIAINGFVSLRSEISVRCSNRIDHNPGVVDVSKRLRVHLSSAPPYENVTIATTRHAPRYQQKKTLYRQNVKVVKAEQTGLQGRRFVQL
ncbi:uncharacterized protein V6R79_008766 [Siganus canaliculatus]